MARLKIIAGICFVMILAGCKEIYKPDIISAPVSYLVVEGVLNAGGGPTTIRLTRTFKLDDSARLRGERNAQVSVEGKDNISRPLSMTGDGVYTSPDLNLAFNEEYRLRIKTTDGKEYESSNITALRTPAIDSLGFHEDNDGVQVYVNSHDGANATRYYRWDFDETWEIRSYYFSQYKFENDQVIDRGAADDVSICWKYNSAKNITLGSTISLASDIVYRAPLIFIPRGDEKLAVRYSILVRQYAMDKKGYGYYELMKKNTETLGTIFDAQPSEANGNIECITNPSEPVIGYVTASSIEEKRFFIRNGEVNNWRFFEDCPTNTVPNIPDSIRQAYQSGQSIFAANFSDFSPRPISYYTSYRPCVECPARGGFLQRPSYW
jgi:hypothetical protein